MKIKDYKRQFAMKWDDVRPVVVYFAGERFVVDYDKQVINEMVPMVAMVHTYLGNHFLTQNDN